MRLQKGSGSISRTDIENAYDAISGHIVETPVVCSESLSSLCGSQVLLKLESLQTTGSFKERGALNKLLTLSSAERRQGVITASAGNHAQGVSYHAQRLGIEATVVMPVGTPLIKVSSTRSYGAQVIVRGESFDDACEFAYDLSKSRGLIFVHPFNDRAVIAGQGTIAMEILRHPLCRDIDAVICPVGGGGLVCGIATYLKETAPSIAIIGVEARRIPSMKSALANGCPVQLPAAHTLADGIAVKRVSGLTYKIADRYVDQMVTVEEDEIADAMLLLLEKQRIVVEGAGAVPLAALVNRRLDLQSKKVLLIITGGNVDLCVLRSIISPDLSDDDPETGSLYADGTPPRLSPRPRR